MKSLRVVSFFIGIMAVAAVADAQCLTCYNEPGGPFTSGTCGESFDGYCDRDCCGNVVGAPCRRPDFLDACDPWLVKSQRSGAPLLDDAVLTPQRQAHYFATRQPVENRTVTLHRGLQKLDARAPKCGARS